MIWSGPLSMGAQLFWLFVLAVPVACVSWTVTHEEVFREPREYCVRRVKTATSIWRRKVFYLFTCEYCFSHYVTLFFLLLTGYRLLLPDWRGFILSLFAVVWVANFYMSAYARLRVDIRAERAEADVREQEKHKVAAEKEIVQAEKERVQREREDRAAA